MNQLWYVLRSKPHKENALWRQAVSQGFEIFYPQIPVKTVNPRACTLVPYFPGYMFVRVDIEQTGLAPFQWMAHAQGLICFDNVPAHVPDILIEAVRIRVAAIVAAASEQSLEFKRGDTVVIKTGPLAGNEAIFDERLSGGDRVRVLLALLNEQCVPVELNVAHLQGSQ